MQTCDKRNLKAKPPQITLGGFAIGAAFANAFMRRFDLLHSTDRYTHAADNRSLYYSWISHRWSTSHRRPWESQYFLGCHRRRYLLSVVRTPHRLSSNPAPHTALWQHCRKCQGVSHVITWSITVLVYCAFPIESGRPTFCLFMQCRTVKSKIESLVLFCDSDLRKFNDTFASMIQNHPLHILVLSRISYEISIR